MSPFYSSLPTQSASTWTALSPYCSAPANAGRQTVPLPNLPPSALPTNLSDPVVTTLAGSGQPAFADGVGLSSYFNDPQGVAVDSFGNVFVADTGNHVIRMVDPISGLVKTIAGTPMSAGYVDGPADTAKFSSPRALAIDSQGSIFVIEVGTYAIRKIQKTPNGYIVSTFSGSATLTGYVDSAPNAVDGADVRFSNLTDIAIDSTDTLYVTDNLNSVIRKVLPSGATSTLAGSGHRGMLDGFGTSAFFNYPVSLTADAYGNIFVSDRSNTAIREISTATLSVTTVFQNAGNAVAVSPHEVLYLFNNCMLFTVTTSGLSPVTPLPLDCGFSNGPLSQAKFGALSNRSMAFDAYGNLYIADETNNAVRKVTVVY